MKDLNETINKLYDGGWRSTDRQQLKSHYKKLKADTINKIVQGLKDVEDSIDTYTYEDAY